MAGPKEHTGYTQTLDKEIEKNRKFNRTIIPLSTKRLSIIHTQNRICMYMKKTKQNTERVEYISALWWSGRTRKWSEFTRGTRRQSGIRSRPGQECRQLHHKV